MPTTTDRWLGLPMTLMQKRITLIASALGLALILLGSARSAVAWFGIDRGRPGALWDSVAANRVVIRDSLLPAVRQIPQLRTAVRALQQSDSVASVERSELATKVDNLNDSMCWLIRRQSSPGSLLPRACR